MPDRILIFLDDLIDLIGNDVMEKYRGNMILEFLDSLIASVGTDVVEKYLDKKRKR